MRRIRYDLAIFIFIAAVLPACDRGTQRLSGVVFEDTNGNGERDAGEPGVPGVLVSNQTNVIATAGDGSYRLAVTDGAVVFVVKPPGYNLPVDDNNLPQFYYVHRPEGSPPSKYPGVSPTGPIPESVDFALIPAQPAESFDVVAFSDPQPRSREEIGFIRDDVVSELVGVDAAFGITLGDIMYDDLSLFGYYNEVISAVGIPFYNVPGNHDMNYDSPDDAGALETYKRHYGPPYYAFEHGCVSFLVLDSVEWLGREDGDSSGTGVYRGRLGEKQLEWIDNYLDHVPDDRLVVLSKHIPLRWEHNDGERVNVGDRDRLFALLENYEVLALAGHMHLFDHAVFGESAGWRGGQPFVQVTCAAVSGSWWSGPKDARGVPTTDQRDGTPNGYHVFRFEGTDWWHDYKAAGRSPGYQLRVSAPVGPVAEAALDTTAIVVNVFAGSPEWTVGVSVDGGPERAMRRTVTTDPYFEAVVRDHPDAFRDWIRPVASGHIWTAPLPPGLVRGVHRITVRATDARGREYSGASIFEVE